MFGKSLAFAQPGNDRIQLFGNLRTRIEIWDWFAGSADSNYAFSGSTLRFGAARQTPALDWHFELEAPVLLDLPVDSVAPGLQGPMGLGGIYFTATDAPTDRAMLFPKQAFLLFKKLDGRGKQKLKAGRFEFSDASEMPPSNPTLAALKRDRIAQRLLGPFGFTHVGRSFDGIQYSYSGSASGITLLAVAPTRGAFQVDGWGPLPIGVFYASYTNAISRKKAAGEFRLFAMYYHDWRNPVKTDNRPIAARRADGNHVRIATTGGHYLQSLELPAGMLDFTFWGVVQLGKWGLLDHRAGAAALEAGYQPIVLKRLKPWFRAGAQFGSGDGNQSDGKHGTFFQILPTARLYARFPFYNMMNMQDAFAELILKPHSQITVRGDVHWLRLSQASDLWYQGSGAFQPWTFGFTGKASGGKRGLGKVFDVSADWQIDKRFSAGLYFAHTNGSSVEQNIYPRGKNANYGYAELTCKF